MEIKYEAIKKAISRVGLEDCTFFEAGGLGHCLVYELQGDEKSPARYSYPSEQVNGADIIMWETIPELFRKPILLHEVAEFLLREPLDNPPYLNRGFDEAHSTAKEWDERFARETLDEKTFTEYVRYRSEYSKVLGQK
jgi:hypothetical protein